MIEDQLYSYLNSPAGEGFAIIIIISLGLFMLGLVYITGMFEPAYDDCRILEKQHGVDIRFCLDYVNNQDTTGAEIKTAYELKPEQNQSDKPVSIKDCHKPELYNIKSICYSYLVENPDSTMRELLDAISTGGWILDKKF